MTIYVCMAMKLKANGKAIKNLRSIAGLAQKQFDTKTTGVSYRNYQRAEGGEELNKSVLEVIATFYDKYLKEQKGYKKNVILDDIIIKNHKNENEIQQTELYLHKINNFEQINNIVKQSEYRQIFYPITPNHEQTDILKKIVRSFTEVFNNFHKIKEKKISDKYEDVELELQTLDNISTFSNLIKSLEDTKLYLYSNNYVHSKLWLEYFDETGQLHAIVKDINYAIFCFRDFRTSSISFKYENNYPRERLLKIIEQNPWAIEAHQSGNPEEAAYIDEEFEKQYKDYFKNANIEFDKSKVNLIKTDIEELVDEDQLQEFVEEAISERQKDGELTVHDDYYDEDFGRDDK